MKSQRRDLWQQYFQHLAPLVGLPHWVVKLTADSAAEDNGAEFRGIFGKFETKISLSADWEDYAPERQREYAVHELIHAHLHQADSYIDKITDAVLSSSEAVRVYKEFDHLTEYAVNTI